MRSGCCFPETVRTRERLLCQFERRESAGGALGVSWRFGGQKQTGGFASGGHVQGDTSVVEHVNQVGESGERVTLDSCEIGHADQLDCAQSLCQPKVLADSERLRAEVIERKDGGVAFDAAGSDYVPGGVELNRRSVARNQCSLAPRAGSESFAGGLLRQSVVLTVADVRDVELGANDIDGGPEAFVVKGLGMRSSGA